MKNNNKGVGEQLGEANYRIEESLSEEGATMKSMCLSIRGPVRWNKLHSDLKNSTTVNMFKKRYKTFFVSEYEAT